ncbi:MAG: hypothetical protein ACODAE_00755 [Gemmatimonadota bacterium]
MGGRRTPGARPGTALPVALLAVGSFVALPAAPAAAQDIALRPALLRDDDGVVPALRITAELASSGLDTRTAFPREWAWSLDVDAPLAWDARRNPERLAADGRIGGRLSLYRPPEPGANPLPDDPGSESWDLGYLALQLRLGLEALQHGDLVDVNIGASLGYEHDRYEALWFVPEWRLEAGLVACAHCDSTVGHDDGTRHSRLDVDLRWSLMLDRGWMPAFGKPLWLRLRGRAFRAWGMPAALAALREVDGAWASIELAYEIDGLDWLDEVHVRWSDGEIPVRLGDRRTWAVGMTVVP